MWNHSGSSSWKNVPPSRVLFEPIDQLYYMCHSLDLRPPTAPQNPPSWRKNQLLKLGSWCLVDGGWKLQRACRRYKTMFKLSWCWWCKGFQMVSGAIRAFPFCSCAEQRPGKKILILQPLRPNCNVIGNVFAQQCAKTPANSPHYACSPLLQLQLLVFVNATCLHQTKSLTTHGHVTF